jgi:hypothetical protein
MILVSDTSVLIDLDRGGLLEAVFGLPDEFAVPDVLYDREMQGNGESSCGIWDSESKKSARQVSPMRCAIDNNAHPYRCQTVSRLLWRKNVEWLLLTGDNALRDLATGENVECHGVLWLLDRLEAAAMPALQLLHDGLSKLAGHPRCRLPVREITIRLERYKVTIERR